jgi:hypothetical protein
LQDHDLAFRRGFAGIELPQFGVARLLAEEADGSAPQVRVLLVFQYVDQPVLVLQAEL